MPTLAKYETKQTHKLNNPIWRTDTIKIAWNSQMITFSCNDCDIITVKFQQTLNEFNKYIIFIWLPRNYIMDALQKQICILCNLAIFFST